MRFLKSVDLTAIPSRRRATVLQAAGGYINTAIVIIQGLLLIPLYLKFIGPHTYGLWLASGGMLGMLGLMNFGISSMVIQRMARAYSKENLAQVGAYFVNSVVIYLGLSALYVIVGWFASTWLPTLFDISGQEADLLGRCFLIAVAALALGILNECLRSFGQSLLRPVVPAISIITGRLTGIGLIIWMLFNEYGLWSIPVGTLATELVIFVMNLTYAAALFLKLNCRIKLDRSILRDYLRTSPALVSARAGNTISKESEPLLITMLLSPELTTVYMVTRKASDIVLRLLNVIIGSTMSTFAHLAGGEDRERTSRIAGKLLALSFCAGTICFATYVATNQSFVSLWVGEDFVLDRWVILSIALGFFSRSLRGLQAQMLYGLGSFTFPSLVILVEGVLRILVAVGLTVMFGVIGVPVAVTITCGVAVLVLGLRLKKELEMRINTFAIARSIMSAALLFAVGFGLTGIGLELESWVEFCLFLTVVLLMVTASYLLVNWTSCRGIYKKASV